MTVKKENIKEHLELYKKVLSNVLARPYVSKEEIEDFANYLDDVIVDAIKSDDYHMSPGSVDGNEYHYNGFNITVNIPIEKTKTIIPDNVDFGMIDDEIEDVLNEMYKGEIEFDVAARMNKHSVEFDIDITLS